MVVDQQQLEPIVTMKGKRTKRPRPLSPLALATREAERDPRGGENCSHESSVESVRTIIDGTEEEDMAHCLMLLAQGSNSNNNSNSSSNNNSSTSYDCKTCNKSFASFQALGGHRASHKKPKLGLGLVVDNQPKKSSIFSLLSDHNQAQQQLYDHQLNNDDGIALSLHINSISNPRSTNVNSNNNNKVAKVHECSICGAEFSSGQALGGHMRRHRPIGGTHTATSTNPTSSQSMSMISGSPNNASRDNKDIKTPNFLSLDLNLPAPEDDHHQQQQQQQEHRNNSKFVFPLNGKTLIFSASSLVDCHY